MRTYAIGQIFGLQQTVTPLALLGMVLVWAIVAATAHRLPDVAIARAISLGALGAVLWWVAELVHQLGHALAARTTGAPMTGIEWGQFALFARSIYPVDELDLPASVHIRRALGGPVASVALGAIAGLVALLLPPQSTAWWAVVYLAGVSMLVMGLGALLPLGFTDGSTLLHWRRVAKQGQPY